MNMDKKIRDEIATVAYGIYEKRGYVAGEDFADWIEAVKIVEKKYSKGMAGDAKASRSAQPVRATERNKIKNR